MSIPNIQQLKRLPILLNRHRLIISWLVILGLFGFTLWQAQSISDPTHDPDYLRRQQTELPSTTINIDTELQQRIEGLLETKVDAEANNLGTRDPFSP
ncbi:MAG: hypothetical protein WD467_02540 [Candidatus Saccharimonadales bacterium]